MSNGADPRELFQRFEGNPILGSPDFPKMVNAVFSPGATVVDGRTLLLLRVEHRTGLSWLVAATSEDGLKRWEIDSVRGLQPRPDHFEEHWGKEDPRITCVGDEYYVVYVGYSTAGHLHDYPVLDQPRPTVIGAAATRRYRTSQRSTRALAGPIEARSVLFPRLLVGLPRRPRPL